MLPLAPILFALCGVATVIALVRIVGLRSFSKMSAFDFVTTIAIGSVLASVVTARTDDTLVSGLLGLVGLFVVIWGASTLRKRLPSVKQLLDNEPILLMQDGRLIEINMTRANVTAEDIYAKLRAANAFDIGRVLAVVMESTGDISVLHGDPDQRVSPELLAHVRH